MTHTQTIILQYMKKYHISHLLSIIVAATLLVGIAQTAGSTNALLSGIGMLIGIALVLGNFGFTGGWSAWINHRDGYGLRIQMVIIAITSIIFYPILSEGSLFGSDVRGFVVPISVAAIFGSFLFGIGMQFGGCCASGALSWIGSGSTRIFLTFLGFMSGAVWGSYDLAYWRSLPGVEVNLIADLGVSGGLGVTLLICTLVISTTLIFEKRKSSNSHHKNASRNVKQNAYLFLKTHWPILTVVITLVLVNFLTLFIAGRPWGVSGAYSLWGAKLITATGINLTFWSNQAALDRSVFFDVTSVMNFGIFLGALITAQFIGVFKIEWNISFKLFLISIIGGIMLGYGSRIAYGCNIGAFYSGVSSGNLGGWIWFISAFIGNIFGVSLKRRFLK